MYIYIVIHLYITYLYLYLSVSIPIYSIPRGSKVWTICMHLGMHVLRASDHAICGLTMVLHAFPTVYFPIDFR